MKKVLLVLFFLFIQVPLAQAFYVIDGNIDDWGVALNVASQQEGYLDTHTPTGGNDIDFVTEDNADKNSGFSYVGPGWSQGNLYDAEAIYFDNDLIYGYLAIVSGLPKSEVTFPSGDIFLDTGKYQDPSSAFFNTQRYAYGIDISNSKLYAVNSWKKVLYPQHNASNPWKIGNNRTFLSDVEFSYSALQNTHSVLEARFLLSSLNLGQDNVWLHWTMKCGNDSLNLKGDTNVIPEPMSLALLGSGLMGGLVFRRKKI